MTFRTVPAAVPLMLLAMVCCQSVLAGLRLPVLPPLFTEDRPAFRSFVPAVFTPPLTFCLEVPLLVWLLEDTVFFVVVTAFFAALFMADAAPDFTAPDLDVLGLAAAFFPAAAIFAAVPLIQAWPLGSVRFTELFPV